MDAKRWNQIKAVYDRALDLRDEEREDFLAEVCGDDDDLCREVESLLAAHANAGTFLQSPAVEVAARRIVADDFISTVTAISPAASQRTGSFVDGVEGVGYCAGDWNNGGLVRMAASASRHPAGGR